MKCSIGKGGRDFVENVYRIVSVFKFVPCVLLLFLSCVVCIVLDLLCMCCFLMCICCAFFFTLDARLLAKSQYSEGPATGHLYAGFSWFSCV